MIKIFIESGENQAIQNGKKTTNEQNFIEEFMAHHFPTRRKGIDFEVKGIGGKDQLANFVFPFKDNTIAGGKNLLIFDADTTVNQGGYQVRSNELLALKPTLGIDFELFLWPNNHDDGDFESLLLQMINPAHQCLLDCFEGFEKCVGGNDPNGKIYKTPDRKSAIYTYINSFIKSQSQEKKMKYGYWFFNDTRYWDLNADAGKPLLKFLNTHT